MDDFFDGEIEFDDDELSFDGIQNFDSLDVHNSFFNIKVPGVFPYTGEGILKFINKADSLQPGELIVHEECKRVFSTEGGAIRLPRAPITGVRDDIPVVIHTGHMSLIENALFGSNDTFDIITSSAAVDYKKTNFDNLTSSIKYIPKRFIRQTIAVQFRNVQDPHILIISKRDKASLFETYVPAFKYDSVTVVSGDFQNTTQRYDIIIMDFSYCYDNNHSVLWENFLKPDGMLFIPCLKDSSLKQDVLSNATISVGQFHDVYSIPIRNKWVKLPFFKDGFYDTLLKDKVYNVHMYESNHMSNFVEIDDMPKELNSLCNVLILHYRGDAALDVHLDFSFTKKDFSPCPVKSRVMFHPSHYTEADLFFMSRGQRCLFSKKTDGIPITLTSAQNKLSAQITLDGVKSYVASVPYEGPKFRIYGECLPGDNVTPKSCFFFDIEFFGSTKCLTSINYYRLNLFRKLFSSSLQFPKLYHSFVGPGEYIVHPSYRNGMLQQKIKADTYLKTALFPTAKKFKHYYDFTYVKGKDIIIRPALSADLKPVIGSVDVFPRPHKPKQNFADVGQSGGYLFEILRTNNPFDDLEISFVVRYFLKDRNAVITNYDVPGLLNKKFFQKMSSMTFTNLFFGCFRGLFAESKYANVPLAFATGTFFDFRLVGGVSVKRHQSVYWYRGSKFYTGTDFKGFFCFSNATILLYDLLLLFLGNRE